VSQVPSIERLVSLTADSFLEFSDTPKLDAELLLCQVLDCNRTYLFTWPDKTVTTEQYLEFQSLCARRNKGEPIAHITGVRDFWSLELEVNPSTLIPRPDTETLVEQALELVQGQFSGTGLDLGTGTGAIALALAKELPKWQWLGVDYSSDAVELAERNRLKNQIENCQFKKSDWYSAINSQKFDLIVSNPPYINKQDPHLNEGDVRFEPLSALVAEDEGLADIKHILSKARSFLSRNGSVLIEHGYDQGESVREIFVQYGYEKVRTITDLSGNDRVSIGYLK